MNKVAYKKFKKKVQTYFETRPNKTVKVEHLKTSLHVEHKDFFVLRDILEELESNEFISKSEKNTYQLNLKSKFELIGKLSVNKSGIGFVAIEDREEDVVIRPKFQKNAFHGDTVGIVLNDSGRKRQEGEIVQIVERGRTKFVGTFQNDGAYGFVIVDDPKIQNDFFIGKNHMAGAKDGEKVVCEMLEWKDRSRRPEAKIIEVIGDPSQPGVDVISIFKAHDIHETFPDDVEAFTNMLKMDVKNELFYRLDLRDEDIFTIDPLDARDFDDAVSLKKLDNGNLVVGVHIADVSHYVQENTPLDKEALGRGCSVYLVDRVIPMLPERLSNDLCSLVPNKDRLTYSCIMELDANSLDIVKYQIKKSVIHSKRRFTYEDAQEILDGAEGDYKDTLLEMNDLAKRIRQKRFDRGSIDFHSPEIRFQLDELGKPVGVVRKKELDSMKLIEEFMLLANKCTSEHIDKLMKGHDIEYPFIYRVHAKPSPQKIEFLLAFLRGMGYEIQLPENLTPKIFQTMMGELLAGDDADIINDIAVRAMMKAEYTPNNIGHFGLGFDHYSHFTSPIRRYPDLVAHRILFEYEMGTSSKRRRFFKRNLPDICRTSTDREIQAERAERESIKMKQVEFISDHIGEEFEGKISGIVDFGIFVEITEFLIEGLVRIHSIEDDLYSYDEKQIKIVGKNKGKSFQLGKKVKIRVLEVNKALQNIDFELVND